LGPPGQVLDGTAGLVEQLVLESPELADAVDRGQERKDIAGQVILRLPRTAETTGDDRQRKSRRPLASTLAAGG